MPKGPPPSEKRLVLENISWQQYEALLFDLNRDRRARLTYAHGRLEMMTPLQEHERCHKLVESFILVLADEMNLAVEGFEAPTLKRLDLQLGTEPDTAYYIQQARQMRGHTHIDLMADPSPDLILEVSLNKSTIDKFPLYAAMGIPEVWRYVSKPGEDFFKGVFQIFCIEADHYHETETGYAFPFLPVGQIRLFIDQSDTLGLMSALRTLRQWVADNHGKPKQGYP